MSHKIMLVDDDATIIETLDYNLRRQGYQIVSFNSGKAALSALDNSACDLLVLDWMLGDMRGPDICRVIRLRQANLPILMLTGKAQPKDVALGLDSGADDYLCKPFSIIELLARVQALLRRTSKPKGSNLLKLAGLTLNVEARQVFKDGHEVELSPKEFQLLKVLMEHAGKTLSTETLLNSVWGSDFNGDSKTVAVHMRWLRKKLEVDSKQPVLLKTVQKAGYRFDCPEGACQLTSESVKEFQ